MEDGPTTYQTVVFTCWTLINVIGVLATIASIGKERKPATAGLAVASMISTGIWIVLFWTAFIL